MNNKQKENLKYWQERIGSAKSRWAAEREKMDSRELQYSGTRKLTKLVPKDKLTETGHVYNITAENIESIVDSNIPKPKVTPRRKKDEHLARIIEHMLLNELDRLPMEEVNDMQERTCPIQGGALYLVEWDNGERSNDRVGEVQITAIHPKMLVPQDGVSRIEDMDFVGLLLPDTKENVERTYGVSVRGETESDPDIKGVAAENTDTAEDMVTRTVVYYRNGDKIGKFHYVGDTVLEDLEDCQARRMKRCAVCGALENSENLILNKPSEQGEYPVGAETGKKAKKGVCAYCGSSKWEDSSEDYMEVFMPMVVGEETLSGEYDIQDDGFGNAVAVAKERIPYYKPRVYPIILQKNVSVFGKLLGDSDCDKVADQQNTINRLEQKMIDRILKAGTRVSLPPQSNITIDPEDGEVWRLDGLDAKQYLGVYQFSGDLSNEMAYLGQVYQESRNILGITDSWQGRQDTTATSGKAKQFAAQQSAGRMESRRVQKNAAYAKIFEMIFKLQLAYCDEPRAVFYKDEHGKTQYEEFNKLDFLERTENGEWRWNTDFLFSVDDSGGLAGNRAALWQELTGQLRAGAMGNPQEMDTLIDYWSAMEQLHYPYAGQMRDRLMERKQNMADAQMQAAAATAPGAGMI